MAILGIAPVLRKTYRMWDYFFEPDKRKEKRKSASKKKAKKAIQEYLPHESLAVSEISISHDHNPNVLTREDAWLAFKLCQELGTQHSNNVAAYCKSLVLQLGSDTRHIEDV